MPTAPSATSVQATRTTPEAAQQELIDLAYAISHDLQAPLRAIIGFLDLLKADLGDALPESAAHSLDRTQQAAVRLRQMIKALVDYSRIGTRGNPFTDIDLVPIVRDALTTSGLKAQVDLPASLPACGDAKQVHEALIHLLENIRTHAPGANVTISGEERDGFMRISIQDDGPGFDPRHTERLLRPFQTLAPKGGDVGHGIGLAIVRRVARRHGGEVHLRPSPGKGLMVRFEIPQAQ